MKCITCKKDMSELTTTFNSSWGDYSLTIHGIKAYKCDQCNELVFSPEEVRMIQNITAGLADSTATEKPDFLNVQEVAELLRVSNQTVYNMLRDGRLSAHKLGKEWRFSRDEIIDAMQGKNEDGSAERGDGLKVGGDFYDLAPLEQEGEYLVKKMYYADLRWAMQESMPCILKIKGEKIQFHFERKHNLPEQKDEVSVVDPLKLAALSADNGCKMEVLDQKTAKRDNWLFVDKISMSDNRYLMLFCDINTSSVMFKLQEQ